MNVMRQLNLLLIAVPVLCVYQFLFHYDYEGAEAAKKHQISPSLKTDTCPTCPLIGSGFEEVSNDSPIFLRWDDLESVPKEKIRLKKNGHFALQRLLYEIVAAAIAHFTATSQDAFKLRIPHHIRKQFPGLKRERWQNMSASFSRNPLLKYIFYGAGAKRSIANFITMIGRVLKADIVFLLKYISAISNFWIRYIFVCARFEIHYFWHRKWRQVKGIWMQWRLFCALSQSVSLSFAVRTMIELRHDQRSAKLLGTWSRFIHLMFILVHPFFVLELDPTNAHSKMCLSLLNVGVTIVAVIVKFVHKQFPKVRRAEAHLRKIGLCDFDGMRVTTSSSRYSRRARHGRRWRCGGTSRRLLFVTIILKLPLILAGPNNPGALSVLPAIGVAGSKLLPVPAPSAVCSRPTIAAAASSIAAAVTIFRYVDRTRQWTVEEKRLRTRCLLCNVPYIPPSPLETEEVQSARRQLMKDECQRVRRERRLAKDEETLRKLCNQKGVPYTPPSKGESEGQCKKRRRDLRRECDKDDVRVKKQRLQMEKERAMKRRAEETPAQTAQRLQMEKERAMIRRAEETPAQTAQRLQMEKERAIIRRAEETLAQAAHRKRAEKKRAEKRRAEESPAKKKLRQQKDAQSKRASSCSRKEQKDSNKKDDDVFNENDVFYNGEVPFIEVNLDGAKRARDLLLRTNTDESGNGCHHRACGCTVCDEFIIGTEEVCWITRDELLEYKDRLGVESYQHYYGGLEIDPELRTQYEIIGMEGMLLSRRFGKDGSCVFMVCSACKASLRRKSDTPPKYSIANGFLIGQIPKVITFNNENGERESMSTTKDIHDDAGNPIHGRTESKVTSIMAAAISPTRPYAYIFSFSGGYHKRIVGNFQFFETDQSKIAGALKCLHESGTASDIYVVLSGRMTPSQKDIVRRKAVLDRDLYFGLLRWFKEHHRGFRKVVVDRDSSAPMIELIEDPNLDDDNEGDHAEEHKEEGATFFFSSGGEPTSDTSVYKTTKELVVALLKDRSAPTLTINGGNYSSHLDVKYLENVFPTMFPFGSGGPTENRRNKISDEEIIRHYLRLSLPPFMESEFVLVANHLLGRILSFKSAVMKCRPLVGEHGTAVGDVIGTMTIDEVQKAVNEEHGANDSAAGKFLKAVSASCRNLGMTEEAAKSARRKCFSLQEFFGMHSLFVTITIDDECSFRVRLYPDADANSEGTLLPPLDSTDAECLADLTLRRKIRKKYPGACSLEYQSSMQIALECLFGWDSNRQKGRRGLFGIMEAYCRADEEQGRGSLHGHFLVWIRNFGHLRRLMFAKDEATRKIARASYIEYINKVMCARQCDFEVDVTIEQECKCKDTGGESNEAGKGRVNELFKNRDASIFREARHEHGCVAHEGRVMQCKECDEKVSPANVTEAVLRSLQKEVSAFSFNYPLSKEQLDIAAYRTVYDVSDVNNQDKCSIMRYILLNERFNQHSHRHARSCFKKGCECRFLFPYLATIATIDGDETDAERMRMLVLQWMQLYRTSEGTVYQRTNHQIDDSVMELSKILLLRLVGLPDSGVGLVITNAAGQDEPQLCDQFNTLLDLVAKVRGLVGKFKDGNQAGEGGLEDETRNLISKFQNDSQQLELDVDIDDLSKGLLVQHLNRSTGTGVLRDNMIALEGLAEEVGAIAGLAVGMTKHGDGTSIYEGETPKEVTRHTLDGESNKENRFVVNNRRDQGCQYMNVYNRVLSYVFGCNSNAVGGDSGQTHYQTLYNTKHTQSDDREPRDLVANSVIRRLLNAQHEAEQRKLGENNTEEEINTWVEGLSRVLSGINAATSRNVISAPMSHSLAYNKGSRFHFSHEFAELLVGQMNDVLEGKGENVTCMIRKCSHEKKMKTWKDVSANDYLYRPEEIDALCFYQQSMYYTKRYKKDGLSASQDGGERMKFGSDHPGSDFAYMSKVKHVKIPNTSLPDKGLCRIEELHIGEDNTCEAVLAKRENYAKIALLMFCPFRGMEGLEHLKHEGSFWETFDAFRRLYFESREQLTYREKCGMDFLLPPSDFDPQEVRNQYLHLSLSGGSTTFWVKGFDILQNIEDRMSMQQCQGRAADVVSDQAPYPEKFAEVDASREKTSEKSDDDIVKDIAFYCEQIENDGLWDIESGTHSRDYTQRRLLDPGSISHSRLVDARIDLASGESVLTKSIDDVTTGDTGASCNDPDPEQCVRETTGRGSYELILQLIKGSLLGGGSYEDVYPVDKIEIENDDDTCDHSQSEINGHTDQNPRRPRPVTLEGVARTVLDEENKRLDEKQYVMYEIIACSFLLGLLLQSEREEEDVHIRKALEISIGARGDAMSDVETLKQKLRDRGARDQLLMFVTGFAGAGKSTAIKVAQRFCYEFCMAASIMWADNTFLFTAYTGSAAAAFGGRTTVKATFIGRKGHTPNLSDEDLKTFEGVRLLIIDEVSFLSDAELLKLDRTMQRLGNNRRPFGGFSIIFAGDFQQNEPVNMKNAQKLWHPTSSRHFVNNINCSIILDGIHRFRDDEAYGRILQKLCRGEMTQKDVDLINTRYVGVDGIKLPKKLDGDTCYACESNKQRNAITAAIFQEHIRQTHPLAGDDEDPPGHTIIIKGLIESRKSSNAKIGPLRQRIIELGDSDMRQGQKLISPHLCCYKGAFFMCNSNDNLEEHGTGNGTQGRLVSVKLTDNPVSYKQEVWDGRKVWTVCASDVKYAEFEHYPRKGPRKTFRLEPKKHTATAKVLLHDGVKDKHPMECSITQLPVNASDAITGHKLQGLTKDNVIVCSWNRSTNWIYVVLSRVRTLSGLFIFKKLSLAHIKPPSRDYIGFLNRMRDLEQIDLTRMRTRRLDQGGAIV